MAKTGRCIPSPELSGRFTGRCFDAFPCLSDPVKRYTFYLRLGLVMLHLFLVGFIFIFVAEFRENSKEHPWHTLIYMLLVVATLVQYIFTSGSSPGYVLDAMRDFATPEASLRASEISNAVVTIDRNQLEENLLGDNPMNWTNLVMDMYPPGTSVGTYTCLRCNVVQPPRAKHCYDCAKCVLQFDHHCVWLGTCIGQGNHCRFWWYILEETAVCIWTGFLYIENLPAHSERAWLVMDVIMIIVISILLIALMFLLLLLLFHSYLIVTNQTTYEILRRRRIPYMSMIPERVYPFSKGACRNLYNFCFVRTSVYAMEPLPRALELEQMSKPYTCFDVVSCRCC